MPTIHFVNEKKEIQVPEGANLRREAKRAGISVYKGVDKLLHCPGWGLCGTCRVLITKGIENTNSKNFRERLKMKGPVAIAYSIGNEEILRLSCQTKVYGDIEVQTHPTPNLFGENFFS